MSNSGMGRDVYPFFDVVHSAFPLPTMALPTLQGAQKDCFGEVVVVYPPLDNSAWKYDGWHFRKKQSHIRDGLSSGVLL